MILENGSNEQYLRLYNKREKVVLKRKGGGSLIQNSPVFSSDSKNVIVNSIFGVKVFNIKTGECVRILDTPDSEDKIVDVFLTGSSSVNAVTFNGKLLQWDNSGKFVSKKDLGGKEEIGVVKKAFLVPNFKKRHKLELCVIFSKKSKVHGELIFYDLEKDEIVQRPLSNLRLKLDRLDHFISTGGLQDVLILAAIDVKRLYLYSLDGNLKVGKGITPGPNREWTCVRCHPEESIVAAGDSTGRVVLYRDPFRGNSGPVAVYHWHTLPCRDIAFTASGSSMYTGGCENVLVKWNLENPEIRHYLPRLSAEIRHIVVSDDNQFVAVSSLDNCIQIVDSSNWLKCILQQMSWGVIQVPGTPLFPAGLTFDPRTKSILLNGRTGHLQLFDPKSETLLFSIDVTEQNYLTQEREKSIINTEVTHSTMSSDGCWLATVETRNDPGVSLEVRLKIWQFIPSKKCFSLSTCIDHPHVSPVHTLSFRPGASMSSVTSDTPDLNQMLVSTGKDKRFRLWTPSEIDSVYKRGVVWGCESAVSYRDKVCGPVSFSEDGSLLAVGFDQSLTVWDVDEIDLKATLTRSCEELRVVQFGRSEVSHLVVTGTDSELSVWSLLTLGLLWRVKLKPSILISDPESIFMAVFTKDNCLYIFSPDSMDPVYKHSGVCRRESKVLGAVFTPRQQENFRAPLWLKNSQLYFIDSSQELNVFESEGEEAERGKIHVVTEDKNAETPFSALIKAKRTSELEEVKPVKHLHFGVLGAKAVSEILKAPAHTMPPVSLLCNSLLKSLALSRTTPASLNMNMSEDEENMEMGNEGNTSSSSSGSEDMGQTNSPKKKSRKKQCKMNDSSSFVVIGKKSKTVEKNVEREPSVQLREEDFLLDEDEDDWKVNKV